MPVATQPRSVDEIRAELEEVRAKKEAVKPPEKKNWYGLVYCDSNGYASIADLDGGIWLGRADEIIPYFRKHHINGENLGSVLLAAEDFQAEKKNQGFPAIAKKMRPSVSKTQSCHLAMKNQKTPITIPPQKYHRATFLKKSLKNDTKLLKLLESLVKEDSGIPTIHRELGQAGYNIPYRTVGRWVSKMRRVMSTTNHRPATKTERIREFVGIVLHDDITDLRGIPVKESTINLGLGLLMVLVTILHFALNIWQFVVSLLLVGYDLIARGLTKIMPAPKIEEEIK